MALTGQQPAEANRAFSRALVGMSAPKVTVETHLPGGLPGFTLVGMPETAVREARDRVKSAIQNCGLEFPAGRVVVNLAPAELAKEGARFDLAIAISVLCATGQVPLERVAGCEFLGELGLFGELRATRGCLCAALAIVEESPPVPATAPGAGVGPRLPEALIVPMANVDECSMDPAHRLLPAAHLMDVVRFLRNPRQHPLRLPHGAETAGTPAGGAGTCASCGLDAVHGQQAAKRALLVAAAGRHHILLVGPPGTGKTMLAQAIQTLLPRLDASAMLEVAAIYSAAAMNPPPAGRPPFRDPHHSSSAPALVGGGGRSLPGEISLAHRGVLFLDELPHFKPSVLNLLREPLESQRINIARADYRACFPAAFQLVAAMNPCPAGRICEPGQCRCTPDQVTRYQSRISGPLLDRIDLHVSVPPLPKDLLLEPPPPRPDENAPADAVASARTAQLARQGKLNAELSAAELLDVAKLQPRARNLLVRATDRYRLSARSAHRVLRTARTVADLNGTTEVDSEQVAEALSYRAMDWEGTLGMAAG